MKKSAYLFIAMQMIVLLACGNSTPKNENITIIEIGDEVDENPSATNNDGELNVQTITGEHEKYALIIAIGKYPRESGWSSISSENDVPLIKNALISQDFDEKNISLISDSEANKEGIVNAIQALTIFSLDRIIQCMY